MTIKLALPIVLGAAALAAAGCGGSAGSSSGAGTGTVAGTVATLSTSTSTTASGTVSFNAKLGGIGQRLQRGLSRLENGNMAGAATVLTTCQDSVTRQLGTRASTARQQQAVSYLRTACNDVAQAQTAFSKGNSSQAQTLAKNALAQVKQAEQALR